MKERILIWEIARGGEYFACTACAWEFPNPRNLTQSQHDMERFHRNSMNTFVISGARLRNLTGDELPLNGGWETSLPFQNGFHGGHQISFRAGLVDETFDTGILEYSSKQAYIV
jgi:hypothetical protein